MVGQQNLDLLIGVRIPARQHQFSLWTNYIKISQQGFGFEPIQ